MEFFDRVSAYPNRYLMTSEDGSTRHVVLERDDEPVAVGTPLNAETFNAMREEYAADVAAVATESAEHPGCYYRIVNGGTEWLNPPMLPGVVYKTAERFCGEVVYATAIDCGKMPNNSQKAVEHGIGMQKAIRFCGYAGTTALPFSMYSWTSGTQTTETIDVSVSSTAVYIKSNYDASAYNGMVQVWFTRG